MLTLAGLKLMTLLLPQPLSTGVSGLGLPYHQQEGYSVFETGSPVAQDSLELTWKLRMTLNF